MGMLQSQGHFQWDDKVTKYWPEFAKNSNNDKEHMTIADVMRHEAGMSMWFEELDLAELNTEGIKKNNFGKVFEN